jgi:hypothetical protein
MSIAINNPLNGVKQICRQGRCVIVKSHGWLSAFVHALANLFFRMAGIPIAFHHTHRAWQEWETKNFQMLNKRYAAFAIGPDQILEEKLPGEDLFKLMNQGRLTPQMVHAAAREFRRAHQLHSDYFAGPWSHGDATMSNVLYDEATDKARLIDFETVHDKSLPAAVRHADDLFVFLLDLIAMSSRRRWLPLALQFVRSYGDPAVIAELQKRLRPPRGIAFIWWRVRTNFVDQRKVVRRVNELRRAITRKIFAKDQPPSDSTDTANGRAARRRQAA